MINYYLLTKPGIIMGNLFTLAAGFFLASKGAIDPWLFLETLVGLAFVMASACVFNNYLDRNIDKKMTRTKQRPLVQGLISGQNAILFATALGIIGFLLLLQFTNLLAVSLAAIGFFVYVVLYTLWKGRTVYGTAIGSIAGAIPPVVGYCAVTNQFDAGAMILYMMMVLWQMPHFFAIAMMYREEYAAAKIPVLPIIKGAFQTKIHMTLYIILFALTAVLLTAFNYTGYLYMIIAIAFSLAWLGLCLQGFKTDNDKSWSRHMFRMSLAAIGAICIAIPLDIA